MFKFYSTSQKKFFRSGFTLIELLVVISIIALLTTLVLASMSAARAKSRDAERVSDLKQIQVALELYYSSQKQYPDQLSAIEPFTESIPGDPKTGRPYDYQVENGGHGYAIRANSDDESTSCQLKSPGVTGFGTNVSICPFNVSNE